MPGSDLPKRPEAEQIIQLHLRAAAKAEAAGEWQEAADRWLDAAVVAARAGSDDRSYEYLQEEQRCIKALEQS